MAQSVFFPSRPKEHTFVNSTQVTINHNLGYIPNVQVLINNELVMADVEHVSVNQLVVTFANATTGSVFIR
tara:strand:+ start:1519 stop:1731 length:213 start_codon:yes stop_codon:yes gene_type:complete